jgi:hypothetical protein
LATASHSNQPIARASKQTNERKERKMLSAEAVAEPCLIISQLNGWHNTSSSQLVS